MKYTLLLLLALFLCTDVFGQALDALPTIDEPQSNDKIHTYTRGFSAAFRLDTLRKFNSADIVTGIATSPYTSIHDSLRGRFFYNSDSLYYADYNRQFFNLTGGPPSASSVTIDTSNLVVVREANLQDYVDANDRALLKARDTGVRTGGFGTVEPGDTTIAISAGEGQVINSQVSLDPKYYDVSWDSETGLSLNTTSPNITYWYIDSLGVTKQTTSIPFGADITSRIYLFRTSYNNGRITGLSSIVVPIQNSPAAISNLSAALGVIKQEGLQPAASGTALRFRVTAGTVFDFGSNWIDETNPHVFYFDQFSTNVVDSFRYAVPAGVIAGNEVDIDVANYAPGGVVTPIPSQNNFGIHYIFVFPGGANYRMGYGDASYKTLSEAKAALDGATARSNVPPGFVNAVLLGAIIAEKNETTNANFTFVQTNRFGLFGGGLVSAAPTDAVQTVTGNYGIDVLNVDPANPVVSVDTNEVATKTYVLQNVYDDTDWTESGSNAYRTGTVTIGSSTAPTSGFGLRLDDDVQFGDNIALGALGGTRMANFGPNNFTGTVGSWSSIINAGTLSFQTASATYNSVIAVGVRHGQSAATVTSSLFVGSNGGQDASSITDSWLLGLQAADDALTISSSFVSGANAFTGVAKNLSNSFIFGSGSGRSPLSTGTTVDGVFLAGDGAGNGMTGAMSHTIAIGKDANKNNSRSRSIVFGEGAGAAQDGEVVFDNGDLTTRLRVGINGLNFDAMATPSAGQVLEYDGTNYVPVTSTGDGNGIEDGGTVLIPVGAQTQGYTWPSGAAFNNREYYGDLIQGSFWNDKYKLGNLGVGYELQMRVDASGNLVSAPFVSITDAQFSQGQLFGDGLAFNTPINDWNLIFDVSKPTIDNGAGTSYQVFQDARPTEDAVLVTDSGGLTEWRAYNEQSYVLKRDIANNSTTVDSTLFTFGVVSGRTYSGTITLWWAPVTGESIKLTLTPSTGTINGDWIDARQTIAENADAVMVISDYASVGKSSTKIDYFFTATATATVTVGFRKNATGTGLSHEFYAGTRLVVDSIEN